MGNATQKFLGHAMSIHPKVPIPEKLEFAYHPPVEDGYYVIKKETECPILVESFQTIIQNNVTEKTPYILALARTNERCEFYDGQSFYNWSVLQKENGCPLPTSMEKVENVVYFILNPHDECFTELVSSQTFTQEWVHCFQYLGNNHETFADTLLSLSPTQKVQEAAFFYFNKAQEAGSPASLGKRALLNLELGRRAKGIALFENALSRQNFVAMEVYATVLKQGLLVRRNIPKAEKIYRDLLKAGYTTPDLLFQLARIDLGSSRSLNDENIEWLRASADGGHTLAASFYGVHVWKTIDKKLGIDYLRFACTGNVQDALKKAALALLKEAPTNEEYVSEAETYLESCIELYDDPEAKTLLACIFLFSSFSKESSRAHLLLEEAQDCGYADAQVVQLISEYFQAKTRKELRKIFRSIEELALVEVPSAQLVYAYALQYELPNKDVKKVYSLKETYTQFTETYPLDVLPYALDAFLFALYT